jgi:hypothetical protein
MAARTRSAGGSFTRISPAPLYGSVISRYADTIRLALQQEEQAELETKILAYQTGISPWESLKSYLEKKILAEEDGTMQKVKLQSKLVELAKEEETRKKNLERAKLEAQKADQGITPAERYDIEKKLLAFETPGTKEYVAQQAKVIDAYEAAQTQKVVQKRGELLKKYEAGGITDQEELLIVRELKTIADPDSAVFTQLLSQEQTILEKLDTAGKEEGKTALANTSRDKIAQIAAAERQSDINYQQGRTTGLDRDQARSQNAEELYDVLQGMANAGISVPQELLIQARQNLNDAQTLTNLRQQGLLFDVVDKDGVLKAITIDGRDPFTGKNVDYQNYPIRTNPLTGKTVIFDPASGEELTSVIDPETGKKIILTNLTEKSAKQIAEKLGLVTFDAILPDASGKATLKTLSRDVTSGAYYNPGNPKEVYFKIPQSGTDAAKFSVTNLADNWRQDPTKTKAVKELVETYSVGLKEGQTILDYNKNLNILKGTLPEDASQKQQSQKSIFENLGSFLSDVQKSPVLKQQGVTPQDVVKTASAIAPQVGPTVTNIGRGVEDLYKNVTANLNIPKFELPSFDFSKIKAPSFDLGFSLPSFSSNKSTSANLPSFDFLGGVKRLGSDLGKTAGSFGSSVKSTVGGLFGKAKGLFGF